MTPPPSPPSPDDPARVVADAAIDENPQANLPANQKPDYWAWTDRWDPGKWETPEHPTPLQRVLAGIALVIVLVMTVYVPLRILKIL